MMIRQQIFLRLWFLAMVMVMVTGTGCLGQLSAQEPVPVTTP